MQLLIIMLTWCSDKPRCDVKRKERRKKQRKVPCHIHRNIELQIFCLNMEHGTAGLPPDVTGVVLSLWRVSVRDDRVPFLLLPFLLLLLRRVLLIYSTFGAFLLPFLLLLLLLLVLLLLRRSLLLSYSTFAA